LRRSGGLTAAGRCGRSLRSPEGRAQALHGAARGSFGRHISLNCYLLRAAIVAATRVGVRRAVRPLCSEGGGRHEKYKSRRHSPRARSGFLRPCTRRFARSLALLRTNGRIRPEAVIEYAVTGLLAWWGGEPGQVGNEAATIVFCQCRGLGSSPFLSPRSLGVFYFCVILRFSSALPVLRTVSRVGGTQRY